MSEQTQVDLDHLERVVRVRGTLMGSEAAALLAEAERLKAENDELRREAGGLTEDGRTVPDLEAEVERLRWERDEAIRLLREEHEAHHSACCVDADDLCHIGQFRAKVDDREDHQ